MAKHAHARAPQGAIGTCRHRRRPRGETRPAWVRAFWLADRLLDATDRLLESTRRKVAASRRCARRRPLRTLRELEELSAELGTAWQRLRRVAQHLAVLNQSPDVPEMLLGKNHSWRRTAATLDEVAEELSALQEDMLRAFLAGDLVPERAADRRPRIVLRPRPVPVRAFLRARQRRVVDRIAAILRRRRHTRRPAALTPPPVTDQGRAPPLSSVCPF